jgi:HK97 family phage portal protein
VTMLRSYRAARSAGMMESPQVPLSGANLAMLFDGPASASGKVVTEHNAETIPAVWRSVRLLSGTSASLPIHSFRVGTKIAVASTLLDDPHPDMTRFELWEWAYQSVLLWGNAYFLKVRNGAGRVVELWPLMPWCVRVGRVKPTEANPSGKVFLLDIDGRKMDATPYDVFHVPGPGYDGVCGVSPIRMARTSLGLTMAAEEFGAKLFGSGSLMSGVLQTEQRLDQPQAEMLKSRWQQKVGGIANAHQVAILDSGVKFQPISIAPDDAQFLQSRSFQVAEVARWFGIPPHMLFETEKSTSWGSGLEQQSLGFVIYTLRSGWLPRFEQRISKELLPTNQQARYAVEGLLRGDTAARAAFYRTMRELGVYSVDEIRDLENLPPLEDGLGAGRLQPLNFAPLGSTPDPALGAGPMDPAQGGE